MKHFRFVHVFIGRSTEGGRMFVDASWDGKRLTLTGEIIERGQRQAHIAGNISAEVHAVCPALSDLWDRWHLNDMRAGCEHQEAWYRESPSLRPTWANEYKGAKTPCPDCGYLYGTAWNTEAVPDEALQEVYDIMRQHKGIDIESI